MFSEDLTAFFSTEDFAVAATYDGAAAVNVIFDNEYIEAATGVSGTNPVALGQAADFASPVGKTLVVSGVTYRIRNARPLDDGAVVALDLEKQ